MPAVGAHATILELAATCLEDDPRFDFLWTHEGDHYGGGWARSRPEGGGRVLKKMAYLGAMGPDMGLAGRLGWLVGSDRRLQKYAELNHYCHTGRFVAAMHRHLLTEPATFRAYAEQGFVEPHKGRELAVSRLPWHPTGWWEAPYQAGRRGEWGYTELCTCSQGCRSRRDPLADARAYLFGYLSHLAADVQVHPFVCTLTGEYRSEEACHDEVVRNPVFPWIPLDIPGWRRPYSNAHEHVFADMAQDVYAYQRYHQGAHPWDGYACLENLRLPLTHEAGPGTERPGPDHRVPAFLRRMWQQGFRDTYGFHIRDADCELLHDGLVNVLWAAFQMPGFVHTLGCWPARAPEIYLVNCDGLTYQDVFERAVRCTVDFWCQALKAEPQVAEWDLFQGVPPAPLYQQWNLDTGYYLDESATAQSGDIVLRHAWNLPLSDFSRQRFRRVDAELGDPSGCAVTGDDAWVTIPDPQTYVKIEEVYWSGSPRPDRAFELEQAWLADQHPPQVSSPQGDPVDVYLLVRFNRDYAHLRAGHRLEVRLHLYRDRWGVDPRAIVPHSGWDALTAEELEQGYLCRPVTAFPDVLRRVTLESGAGPWHLYCDVEVCFHPYGSGESIRLTASSYYLNRARQTEPPAPLHLVLHPGQAIKATGPVSPQTPAVTTS